jgi:sodium/potassium-transporting ATPase subunit alpha
VNLLTLCTAADVAEADGVPVSEVDVLHDSRVQALVLAGTELNGLTPSDWDAICAKPEIVFARTTPQQKLEIVMNMQRNGEMVTVTGDGVNDAPALKQANIGVAMGSKNASDVARDVSVALPRNPCLLGCENDVDARPFELTPLFLLHRRFVACNLKLGQAGDIILLDDNFASIVVGIEAGRLLFDNLKKTVAYTVTHILPEIFPFILNLLFGMVSFRWVIQTHPAIAEVLSQDSS